MTSVDDVAGSNVAAPGGGAGVKLASGILGPLAVGLALLSAAVTFLVLTGLTPILPTHEVVVTVLLANVATVLILLAIIVREVVPIVQAWRRGRAGARLHVRIIGLFSVIAAVPAILVAIVASITLDRGLDRWFSSRTQALIANSLTVAEVYFREHAAMIRSDIVAMAIDLGRAKPLFDQDRARFRQYLTAQAAYRGLPNVAIIRSDLSVIERTEDARPGQHDVPPPAAGALTDVSDSDPQVALLTEAKTVAAVIKLRGYDNAYLYVSRPVDPRVAEQLEATQASVAEYASLQERRLGVQVAFALMYTVIALIVLLSAVWIGLNFAKSLVAPIRRLIGAADQVSTGNLYVQVPVRPGEGDLAQLGETFNKMTQELRTQRDDLMRAHNLIDSRRRFTEAVLAGASAGVIGVDPDGKISILNRSAEKLIGHIEADALGRPLAEVAPELAALFAEARSGFQRLVQGQVMIKRGGRDRNLSVRVTTEQSAVAQHGFVITLDDITDLVTAQRTSAWADVARRIAHEIKNPLTPIQLSAERLRRKYGAAISDDKAVFEQCTDTIVRQVEDIKRMVDEFSKFARMPKPVMTAEDVADTVRQAVFLMRVGNADIDIEAETPEGPLPAEFDRRLISQGLTNIIKNATEAIAAVPPGELDRGRIKVQVKRDGGDIIIDVFDNGIGLPKDNRNRLLEPYVTTREKGTGLGLAIVGRILEEHGGSIELNDLPKGMFGGRGAWARLRFAAAHVAAKAGEPVPEVRKVASER
jgi:two-component system, NtrC family, nitrogen regulation sensor histidine kinase NtrY